MGRLVIAHHKSYHPYRRDNIEKVRRDEEEARQKEAKEEGRLMLADAEARIEQLRERAGIRSTKKGKGREDDIDTALREQVQASSGSSTSAGKHINLFEDLENAQDAIAASIRNATKKVGASTAETEKGVPLAPSKKDLNPWYSEKTSEPPEKDELDEVMRRDSLRKSMHDPLTSITKQLASSNKPWGHSFPSSSSRKPNRMPPPSNSSHGSSSGAPSQLESRLNRESSERERALALIARKKREMAGSETPSTVYNDADEFSSDMYNRREVVEAHKGRDRRRDYGYHDRRW